MFWAKRDWPAYHAAMSAAKRAQAIAFHHYHNSLLLKLKTGSNNWLWWKITKDIGGLLDLLLMLVALLTILTISCHCPLTLILTLPSEVVTVTCKKSWQIKLSKVRHVLNSLDVYIGPDNVSPHIEAL